MFIRIKTTPKSPRKSVQIVESYRIEGSVRQKIVKHIGIAKDDNELVALKALAHFIKTKISLDGQLPLHSPDEIEQMCQQAADNSYDKTTLTLQDKQALGNNNQPNRKDYEVNLLDIEEQARAVKGIHDIYGKLYNELGLNTIIGGSEQP